MIEEIRAAWATLRSKAFPGPSLSPVVTELRADLANITTFGSGCIDAFVRRGRLGPNHLSVLLRCLNALQALEGKIAVASYAKSQCDTAEIDGVVSYKEALERLLESIVISFEGSAKRRGAR